MRDCHNHRLNLTLVPTHHDYRHSPYLLSSTKCLFPWFRSAPSTTKLSLRAGMLLMLGYSKNYHFCGNFCKLDFAIAVASIYVSETHSKHTLEQDGQPKTVDSTIRDRCSDLINVDNPIRHIRYTKHGRLVYRVTEPITVRTPSSICIHNFDLNSEFAR